MQRQELCRESLHFLEETDRDPRSSGAVRRIDDLLQVMGYAVPEHQDGDLKAD